MLGKLIEIATAWTRAAAPTDPQQTLAAERLDTCFKCPTRKVTTAGSICGACGCPLSKKVYSPRPGPDACPEKRWTR